MQSPAKTFVDKGNCFYKGSHTNFYFYTQMSRDKTNFVTYFFSTPMTLTFQDVRWNYRGFRNFSIVRYFIEHCNIKFHVFIYCMCSYVSYIDFYAHS